MLKRKLVYTKRFLSNRLYLIIRLYVKFFIKTRNFNKRKPILIYTYGKVASSSIYYTLKQHGFLSFHIHVFDKNNLEKIIKNRLSKGMSIPYHAILSLELLKYIQKKQIQFNIITCIREPIGQRLSAFFQSSEKYKDKFVQEELEFNYNDVIFLINEILNDAQKINYEQNWFHNSIKKNFGIDVFSIPFDYEHKYNIYSNENSNLLLMRLEDLDNIFKDAVEKFLSPKKPVTFIKKNEGGKKFYKKAYNKVIKDFKIDSDLLNTYTNTQFFQHFYTDKTNDLRKRWEKTKS